MINLVLPIDFGDATDKLLNAAIEFAKNMNGKLHVIHVAPSDIGFAIGEMGFQYFPEIEQAEIKEELQQLNRIEKQIVAEGLKCEHILRQGPAGDIILEYAEEKEASYIILGSHGRSGIYDVIVGSLTKEITRRSKIPVLVIPVRQ